MTLLADLARSRTEEDVKDAYIKALGLKSYSKGLVDIHTEDVWFEAKDAPTPPIVMFAQLIFYIRAAKKRGEAIPAFLAVIDGEKAAIMPTERALPLLERWHMKPHRNPRRSRDSKRRAAVLSTPPPVWLLINVGPPRPVPRP